jgi:hypothetical protein
MKSRSGRVPRYECRARRCEGCIFAIMKVASGDIAGERVAEYSQIARVV